MPLEIADEVAQPLAIDTEACADLVRRFDRRGGGRNVVGLCRKRHGLRHEAATGAYPASMMGDIARGIKRKGKNMSQF
jgi:hypothetical protein